MSDINDNERPSRISAGYWLRMSALRILGIDFNDEMMTKEDLVQRCQQLKQEAERNEDVQIVGDIYEVAESIFGEAIDEQGSIDAERPWNMPMFNPDKAR